MNLISTAPLVQAIGWALLHLVWEGFLVGAILAAVLSLLQRRSANARYLASCGALLTLVCLGVITAIRAYQPAITLVPGATAADPSTALSFSDVATETFSWIGFAGEHLTEIVLIWLAGVLILSARLGASWIGAHRLARDRAHAAPAEWETSLRRIASALDVRRSIRILESAAVDVPAVVGWMRPVILLPIASLSGLSIEQIEMILAHELAHIRRHDFIVNVLQSVVETLLFYHPAVWWMSRRIRIEREHCCDDLAVSLFGDPVQYAHALTRFEELRMDTRGVLAATGGSLLARVRRLVTGAESSDWTSRWAAGGALLTVFAAFLIAPSLPLFASHEPQNPPPPHAVTSKDKKSCPPSNGVEGGVKGGVAGGVVGGIDTTKCNPAPGAEIEVDADATDPDTEITEPPDPPDPPEPPTPFVVDVGPIVSQSMVDVGPIVSRSMVAAQKAVAEAMRNFHVRAVVSPDCLGSMKLSAHDFADLKSLMVTPAYVEEMRNAGIANLSDEEWAQLRFAGVTADYVREMKAAGYTHLAVRELVQMRMQGLTPEFVRALADAGYTNLPVRDLVRLRAMGVDAEFIRELSKYRTK